MRRPEQMVQAAVVDYLRRVLPRGSIVAAVRNEAQPKSETDAGRTRFQAARREQGVWPGFPDLIILLPGGRSCFIEMKAPDIGRLSDAQRNAHVSLVSLGFSCGVATSIDDARDLLQEWGIETNER